ncbi:MULTISPECIES: hypothetical protein [unclassified Haloferax]|uniref:hypothetical protein n=1 Tax=unclassified Haloferax TaxID=2625095 RepID=UPI0011C07779|nr:MULTISPECIES: hypothetical protein [unclassified Haloferax]
MGPETSTLLTFLQLIVLAFTALIYVGQSLLRSEFLENDDQISRTHLLESSRIFWVGIVFMVLSGVSVSVYLIPKLAFEKVLVGQSWLVNFSLFDPWKTPPILVLLTSSILVYLISVDWTDEEGSNNLWWGALSSLLSVWLVSAITTVIAYFRWVPAFAAGCFALGMTLFLVGVLRLSQGLLRRL